MQPVHVIGAGLAGSEATYQLTRYGVPVILHEMRPAQSDPAHKTGDFAELVCSNSLRAANVENAVGLLKEEMRRLGSVIMQQADAHQVPAGGALAVDRDGFAAGVTAAVRSLPLVTVVDGRSYGSVEAGRNGHRGQRSFDFAGFVRSYPDALSGRTICTFLMRRRPSWQPIP
jgi:tRNA:m(5)U-54 methyltransferase